MEKLKIGDKIIITNIEKNGERRYWSSGQGICPQDLQLPYITTVKSLADESSNYAVFGDGTYGFWTQKTTWQYVDSNYEIY